VGRSHRPAHRAKMLDVVDDSRQLRRTVDSAADQDQHARPGYPEQLFDTLIEVAALRRGDRLLEVGCASGKATLPLARRGFRITCVEIGPALAAAARTNLADFARVDVVEGAFETWKPPAGSRFDLVFAATAWHWLDPMVRWSSTTPTDTCDCSTPSLATSRCRPGSATACTERSADASRSDTTGACVATGRCAPGRPPRPRIARPVASDVSAWTTGITLDIAGGQIMP
jgi:SAM-dependent methyltransferase